MRPVSHAPMPCPSCGTVLDRSRAVFADRGNPPPTMGDLTICSSCAAVLEFGYDGGPYGRPKLKLDLVPPEKFAAFPPTVRTELDYAVKATRRRLRARGVGLAA